jgi:hypothetical protein
VFWKRRLRRRRRCLCFFTVESIPTGWSYTTPSRVYIYIFKRDESLSLFTNTFALFVISNWINFVFIYIWWAFSFVPGSLFADSKNDITTTKNTKGTAQSAHILHPFFSHFPLSLCDWTYNEVPIVLRYVDILDITYATCFYWRRNKYQRLSISTFFYVHSLILYRRFRLQSGKDRKKRKIGLFNNSIPSVPPPFTVLPT